MLIKQETQFYAFLIYAAYYGIFKKCLFWTSVISWEKVSAIFLVL